jgi:DAK2 domain fusion protein YloV
MIGQNTLSSFSKDSSGLRTCDGAQMKRLAAASLAWLEQNYESVNQLNVFPVPDGDTGTNMLLTMRAAYREIAANDSPDAALIADKLAFGAIMGSRGNSGTILSQLLRGFAHSIAGHLEFDAELMAGGFREAARMAYKAVQTPVEGTILTVAREVAEEVETVVQQSGDLRFLLERAVERAKLSVARTPDLLPILKKAGVVDSGGQGLALILEGMHRYMQGDPLTVTNSQPAESAESAALREVLRASDERGYGYDVQYVLRGSGLDLDSVRNDIGNMGDSMVVVGDSSLIKVHIHVHDPGVPLSYGAKLGVLTDIVVENMQEQSEGYIAMREGDESESKPGEPTVEELEPLIPIHEGDIAVVAVSPGNGLRRVFRDLGAAYVVSGGQTMNPSTEELLNAVQRLNTDKVILLPNNKNVILAAEQAAKLAAGAGKQVIVIPTRTIPQGITSMLSYSANGDFENVVASMQDAINNVVTGEVTTATRSVELDGLHVESGQVIGLVDGKLAVAGHDLPTVVRDLLEQMGAQHREVITLYYGDNVTQSQAKALADELQRAYPDQEFDVIQGGQPHYHFILSAE